MTDKPKPFYGMDLLKLGLVVGAAALVPKAVTDVLDSSSESLKIPLPKPHETDEGFYYSTFKSHGRHVDMTNVLQNGQPTPAIYFHEAVLKDKSFFNLTNKGVLSARAIDITDGRTLEDHIISSEEIEVMKRTGASVVYENLVWDPKYILLSRENAKIEFYSTAFMAFTTTLVNLVRSVK